MTLMLNVFTLPLCLTDGMILLRYPQIPRCGRTEIVLILLDHFMVARVGVDFRARVRIPVIYDS